MTLFSVKISLFTGQHRCGYLSGRQSEGGVVGVSVALALALVGVRTGAIQSIEDQSTSGCYQRGSK